MNFTLLPFQETTVAKAVSELRLSMEEVARVGPQASAQAVTLAAPTGAGKTVMAAAALEALLWGDLVDPGDEAITVVWLSDLPNVNDQTRSKIEKASERLTRDRLVQVDTNFRGDSFAPGRVYFLNTQKLSVSSTLVEPNEDQPFTIWEIINRTIARDPARFLLIIDEAHRGMDRPTSAVAEQAASITQRFILGSPDMARSPVILGISATPQRFDDLVAGANRTMRRAEADIAEVRGSGLLKERIIVWRPEHGLEHSEVTLLQRAAQTLQDYDTRWARYTGTERLPRVSPILVVQVEDRNSNSITATDLHAAIDAIEEVTGPLHPDSYAHSFGDAQGPIDLGSRRIRYLKPVDIDDDPQVTVVFFKTSLSTGWDCPRAEVIMSFRTARDATFIAQLVGRMVRTPLHRRIESDEVLNSVALYLPKYDRGAVQSIVRQLRAGDPDFLPGLEAEEGEGLIACERDEALFAQFSEAAHRVRTYTVPRPRRMPPVRRLESLAGSLSDFDLYAEAPEEMHQRLVQVLLDRLNHRLGQEEFARAIERCRQVGLNSTTLSLLTGETVQTTIQVQSTSRSLERVYEQAGNRVGAGLHDKLWRRLRTETPDVDGSTAQLYVIATLSDSASRDGLETQARQLFQDWFARYQDEIDELPEHQRTDFALIREHADDPSAGALALPLTVRSRRNAQSIDYDRSLYQDEDGQFPEKFNEWEKDVVETELARPVEPVICWVRNKPRQDWALTVPYEDAMGTATAMYPDFLFFRKHDNQVVVDLVDPHGVHIPDAPAKARGMAKYARRHGHLFGRFELVIYDKETRRRKTLDLKNVDVRGHVLAVTTTNHLTALFTLAGT